MSIRLNTNFIWDIFLFVLMFGPPFVPYSHLVLAVLSCAVIVLFYSSTCAGIILYSKSYLWIVTMMVLGIYVLIIPFPISLLKGDIVNYNNYSAVFNRFAALTFSVIPCCTLFLCMVKNKGQDISFVIERIIWAGVLETICCVSAYFIPSVKRFFIKMMYENTNSNIYTNKWYVTIRAYGFASTLVDLFGLGIALIAGLAFVYGLAYKRRFILISFFISVSALLNARTGFIIYLIGVLVAFLMSLKYREIGFFRLIRTILISIVFGYLLYKVVSGNQYTYSWLRIGVRSIIRFLRGSSTKTLGSGDSLHNLFYKQNWELPKGSRVFWGTAHSLYNAQGYRHSDVGYVNDIWIFGLAGVSFLYGMILFLAFRIMRMKEFIYRFSAMFTFLAFCIFNIKGSALGYNPGAATMLSILFIMNYFCSIKEENA